MNQINMPSENTNNDYPLIASVTTGLAYRTHFSKRICNYLAEVAGMSEETHTLALTALSEAVLNGAIHGNLELDAIAVDDEQGGALEAFQAHYRAVHERLEDQTYSERRIEFSARGDSEEIEISVGDQGQGYHGHVSTFYRKAHGPSGRGLRIIESAARSVEISQGGAQNYDDVLEITAPTFVGVIPRYGNRQSVGQNGHLAISIQNVWGVGSLPVRRHHTGGS
ncbi:MAG: hypothetical protein VCE74_14455 [Alphaproteobacteria bacterium]